MQIEYIDESTLLIAVHLLIQWANRGTKILYIYISVYEKIIKSNEKKVKLNEVKSNNSISLFEKVKFQVKLTWLFNEKL